MALGCGGGSIIGGIGGKGGERLLSCAGNSGDSRATPSREAKASYLPTRLLS